MSENAGQVIKSPIGLREAVVMFRRRWKLGLSVAALAFSAILVIILLLPNQYRATAQLTIDPTGGRLIGMSNSVAPGSGLTTEIETQAAVVVSQNVLKETLERLRLWTVEGYRVQPSVLDRLLNLIRIRRLPNIDYGSIASIEDLPADIRSKMLEQLSDAVSSNRVGLTSVVAVHAVAATPELAASIANSITASYLDGQIEAGIETAQRAASFLDARKNALSAQIDSGDQRISDFIAKVRSDSLPPEVRRQMEDMQRGIVDLASQRSQLQNRIDAYQRYLAEGDPSVLAGQPQDDEIARMTAQRGDLVAALSDVDGTAKAAALRRDLDRLDKQLRANVDDSAKALTGNLATLDDQSVAIRQSFQAVLTQQDLSSEAATQLFRLQKDVETARSLYASYVQRLEEVRQQTTMTVSDSRIISEATAPIDPSSPPRRLIAVAGLIAACGAGIAVVLAREVLFGGFVTAAQFENVSGKEVAAIIPLSTAEDPHSEITARSFSLYSEAIRRLRATIAMQADQKCLVAMVTSSEQGEGKTTLALSLARDFAIAGKRTVIIDADLRRPTVAPRLGKPDADGLNRFFLSGNSTSIFDEFGFGDQVLWVVGAGSAHSAATDVLLSSSKFVELIRELRDQVDVIIIDTPPINLLIDARVVANVADVVVFAVRHGASSQRSVVAGLRAMSGVENGRIFAVLNGVPKGLGSYSGYYANSTYEPDTVPS